MLKSWITQLGGMLQAFLEAFVLTYLGIAVAAIIVSEWVVGFDYGHSPLSPLAHTLGDWLTTYGGALIVILFVIKFARLDPFGKKASPHALVQCSLITASQFLMLGIALLFIQQIALPYTPKALSFFAMTLDDLIALDALIIISAFFIIMNVIFKASNSLFKLKDDIITMGPLALTKAFTKQALPGRVISEEDYVATCRHEAGHIMIFALLKSLPIRLSASVGGVSHPGTVGRVTYSEPLSRIANEDEVLFNMLLALGGMASENHYGYRGLLGSGRDMEDWKRNAITYYGIGRDNYTLNPGNALELEHNSAILKGLQMDQLQWLSGFFTDNSVVLDQLSQTLIMTRQIDKETIKKALAAVDIKGINLFNLKFDPASMALII